MDLYPTSFITYTRYGEMSLVEQALLQQKETYVPVPDREKPC